MQEIRMPSFAAYRSLMLTRNAEGVLVIEFHTSGGLRPVVDPRHRHRI